MADWWEARRTWVDVLRCAVGLHRPYTTGAVDGMIIQRCSCGAFGPRPWLFLCPGERRGVWRRREWRPKPAEQTPELLARLEELTGRYDRERAERQASSGG